MNDTFQGKSETISPSLPSRPLTIVLNSPLQSFSNTTPNFGLSTHWTTSVNVRFLPAVSLVGVYFSPSALFLPKLQTLEGLDQVHFSRSVPWSKSSRGSQRTSLFKGYQVTNLEILRLGRPWGSPQPSPSVQACPREPQAPRGRPIPARPGPWPFTWIRLLMCPCHSRCTNRVSSASSSNTSWSPELGISGTARTQDISEEALGPGPPEVPASASGQGAGRKGRWRMKGRVRLLQPCD